MSDPSSMLLFVILLFFEPPPLIEDKSLFLSIINNYNKMIKVETLLRIKPLDAKHKL